MVSITPPSFKCLLPILQLLSNTAEGFSLQKDIEVSFRFHFTSQRNQTSLVGKCTLVTVTIKEKFVRRENTRNQCVRGNIFSAFSPKKETVEDAKVDFWREVKIAFSVLSSATFVFCNFDH